MPCSVDPLYFEVGIVEGLPPFQKRLIIDLEIGLSTKESMRQGWDVGTVCYMSRSDKMCAILQAGKVLVESSRLENGDTLGIYIQTHNLAYGNVMSYQMTKMGDFYGPHKIIGNEELYPTIYSRSSGLVVEINFDQKNFQFEPGNNFDLTLNIVLNIVNEISNLHFI